MIDIVIKFGGYKIVRDSLCPPETSKLKLDPPHVGGEPLP